MSEAIKATIAELQNQIANWEREILETKRVCNTLAHRAGLSPIYGESELQTRDSIGTLRRDQYYGKTLTTAMREFLQMRRQGNLGPATVQDIFEGLSQGGFDHGSANDDNARRVIRITLTKNSSIFHRLPDDKHFGLMEWYPNVRNRRVKDAGEEGEPTSGIAPQLEVKAHRLETVEPKPWSHVDSSMIRKE